MFVWGFDGALYNGWQPGNNATRQMLRDAGWAEYDSSGSLTRQHVGAVSLGDLNLGAQVYYQRSSSGPPANFTFTDEVNEGIQVFGDINNGNFDERIYFKIFAREYAQQYAKADLSLVGETATGPYKIGFPLANSADLKISDIDALVTSSSPYTQIGVKYFTGSYFKDVDTVGTSRTFGIVVDVGTWSGVDGIVSASGGSTLVSNQGIVSSSLFTTGTLTINARSEQRYI